MLPQQLEGRGGPGGALAAGRGAGRPPPPRRPSTPSSGPAASGEPRPLQPQGKITARRPGPLLAELELP